MELNCWPPRLIVIINLCCFKLLCLWQRLTAALGTNTRRVESHMLETREEANLARGKQRVQERGPVVLRSIRFKNETPTTVGVSPQEFLAEGTPSITSFPGGELRRAERHPRDWGSCSRTSPSVARLDHQQDEGS